MLEQFLATQTAAFFLIFLRMGAGIMVMPGIGEMYVPPRIRLLLALSVALCLTPVLAAKMPALPGSPLGVGLLVLAETLTGLFIGGIARLMLSAMHALGTIISFQSSLSSATLFDPTQATQGTALGNILSLTAVVMMFSLNLHHLILQGLAESYSLFPAGSMPPVGEFSNLATSIVSKSFLMAVQLSMPFLIVGLLVNLGGGVLTKLMPTLQVFFLLMAPQILLSMALLSLLFGAIMMVYMDFLRDGLSGYLSPGS